MKHLLILLFLYNPEKKEYEHYNKNNYDKNIVNKNIIIILNKFIYRIFEDQIILILLFKIYFKNTIMHHRCK